MKFAILSDVHGNLEAFQAVSDDLEKEKVDRVFFLGDIVGYGADPNECVELVQELTKWLVAGNHDWAAVGLTDTSYFNPVAKTAMEWTAKKITLHHQEFLKKLPLTQKYQNFILVHATPYQPEAWHYIFSLREASFSFKFFKENICFIGHSHTPMNFVHNQEGVTSLLHDTPFILEDSHRYLINVGSVGQPRDGDPRAAYGIYCPNDARFMLKRIPYDIEHTQKKIVEAGLPLFLAQRLAAGR